MWIGTVGLSELVLGLVLQKMDHLTKLKKLTIKGLIKTSSRNKFQPVRYLGKKCCRFISMVNSASTPLELGAALSSLLAFFGDSINSLSRLLFLDDDDRLGDVLLEDFSDIGYRL